MALQYVKIGNLRGPQGEQGIQGEKGDTGLAGASLHIANVDVMSNSDVAVSALSPAAPLNVNDLVSDVNGDLYTITSVAEDGTTVHVSNAIAGVSFKGPQGETGAAGPQGEQGAQGKPFQIAKLYASVNEMNADYGNADIAQGAFVLINTGNVQDEDNAKLYVKGTKKYDFVTDLSGAAGIQGPEGPAGAQGEPGAAGKDGTNGANGADGKSIRFSTSEPTDEHKIPLADLTDATANVGDLLVSTTGALLRVTAKDATNVTVEDVASIKGAQGEQGIQGEKGDTGVAGHSTFTSTATPNGDGLVPKNTVSGTPVVGDTIIAGDAKAYPVITVGNDNYKLDVANGVSLKGAQGEQGIQGEPGAAGQDGAAGAAGKDAPLPVASPTEPEDKTAGKLWIKTDGQGNAVELYIGQDVA